MNLCRCWSVCIIAFNWWTYLYLISLCQKYLWLLFMYCLLFYTTRGETLQLTWLNHSDSLKKCLFEEIKLKKKLLLFKLLKCSKWRNELLTVCSFISVYLQYFHSYLLTAFLKAQQLMMDSEVISAIRVNAVRVMQIKKSRQFKYTGTVCVMEGQKKDCQILLFFLNGCFTWKIWETSSWTLKCVAYLGSWSI